MFMRYGHSNLSSLQLLALVSQPVKAVILLFPDVQEIAERRKAEDIELAQGPQPKLDKTIFWIKQTVGFHPDLRQSLHGSKWSSFGQIRNACGTMALIHALANVRSSTAPQTISHSNI